MQRWQVHCVVPTLWVRGGSYTPYNGPRLVYGLERALDDASYDDRQIALFLIRHPSEVLVNAVWR